MLDEKLLHALAERLGVSDGYYALNGDYIKTDNASKCAALKGFGINTENGAEAAAQLQALERASTRIIPKTIVRRTSDTLEIDLKAPPGQPKRQVKWRLVLESGKQLSGCASSDGSIKISKKLPTGYHQLQLQLSANDIVSSHFIVTPETATAVEQNLCGITLPLYGLRSERNWGVGDFEDLAAFCEKAAAHGLDFVGINPVHALFPQKAAFYSPYSPSSRRYLNVMLIAPDKVPELNKAPKGKALLRQTLASQDYRSARNAELVDYETVYRLKWRALRTGFRVMENRKPSNMRLKAFAKFIEAEGGVLHRHTLYETIADVLGSECDPAYDWTKWPAGLQDPNSEICTAFAKKHSDSMRFYAFLQWLAAEQLAQAHKRALAAGMTVGLYLDIAVGMMPGGAEAWGNSHEIAPDISLGAPGDAANPDGQKWNLAPLDPEAMMETGFGLLRETLRATMKWAGMVRIDHILGVNRCFWAPLSGEHAGAYVSYPSAEILGIIALESKRHNCIAIGENLGIIPPDFNQLLQSHGLLGCVLFPFTRKQGGAFRQAGEYQHLQLVSLGNHDFPTIRGYWEGADIEVRKKLGIGTNDQQMAQNLYLRDRDREAIFQLLNDENLLPDGMDPNNPPKEFSTALNAALHRFIARTNTCAVALQLEDLLALREQSNLPGTTDEYPNWRRKIHMPLEEIFDEKTVITLVQAARLERAPICPEPRKSA